MNLNCKNICGRIILVVILFLSSTCFASSPYVKLVEKADKAISKDNYDEAIGYLTEALRLEPDNSGNVMLLSNLGMLSYYTGADSLAISYLSMAHDIAPQSITILSNRAKVLSSTGYYRDAIDDYTSISQLDSTLYEPYLNKGIIYLTLGDLENASIELKKVQGLTDISESVEINAALAMLASMQEDYNNGLKYYTALINLDPAAEFYASRALCHTKLEQYIEASEDIAAGMELDNECSELYVARAFLNKCMYRNDDSLKDAQKAIDLGADSNRLRKLLNL